MSKSVPLPALGRLCTLFHIIEELLNSGVDVSSSKELSLLTGITAQTIRKDRTYLPDTLGAKGSAYNLQRMYETLRDALGLGRKRKACLVGLGNLGTAFLNGKGALPEEFEIAAGFDPNINLVETTKTYFPLYASYEIEDVVSRLNIEVGLIAVSVKEAQKCADRLISGGVKGIINFTPCILKVPDYVLVKNLYVVEEFRILSSLLYEREKNAKE